MSAVTDMNGAEPSPLLFEEAPDNPPDNEFEDRRDGGAHLPRPIYRRRGTKRERVLAYLRAGNSLTMAQARDLFGCQSIAGMISLLKNEDGWPIESFRTKGDDGVWFTTYYMHESAVIRDEDPSGTSDEAVFDEVGPDAFPETVTVPAYLPEQPSAMNPVAPPPRDIHPTPVPIEDMAFYATDQGLDFQINGVRYRPTRTQMRLMAMNLHFGADTEGRT